ncbi:hypothetical protein [Paenibacillus nasutitermitis]|uniref:Lipoprotein n=1 Tax=Paenibacillus nasutitermitis TaxID=1652958 RepID=A0A917DZA9_9BACL|nr:hypothetical protein [Paenibacillus nasutitermitis]GGD84409.1 hypothetical protein GCM10010911_48390 [Paenibacillus nasutitermitis]
MKKIVLTLFMVLVLAAGCTTEPDINLNDISTVIADKGVELLEENEEMNRFVLEGLKATTYMLDNGEAISIYLFRSVKKREQGLADFNKQKEKYDMQIPAIFEVKNALIFYWYKGPSTQPGQYDANIKEAVQALYVSG